MANCILTKAVVNANCEYQQGGLRSLYLINYDDFKAINVSIVGEIVKEIPEVDSYVIEFGEETANFTDELVVNGANKYRTHTVTAVLPASENADTQARQLSLGHYTWVAVTKNGVGYLGASENGAFPSTYNFASGSAAGDATGWTLTLVASEKTEVKRIDASALEAFEEDAHRGDTSIG